LQTRDASHKVTRTHTTHGVCAFRGKDLPRAAGNVLQEYMYNRTCNLLEISLTRHFKSSDRNPPPLVLPPQNFAPPIPSSPAEEYGQRRRLERTGWASARSFPSTLPMSPARFLPQLASFEFLRSSSMAASLMPSRKILLLKILICDHIILVHGLLQLPNEILLALLALHFAPSHLQLCERRCNFKKLQLQDGSA
jgi:hypothetical protein